MHPIYAEHFEPIIGDLVWIRADVENAVKAMLLECNRDIGVPLPVAMAELVTLSSPVYKLISLSVRPAAPRETEDSSRRFDFKT